MVSKATHLNGLGGLILSRRTDALALGAGAGAGTRTGDRGGLLGRGGRRRSGTPEPDEEAAATAESPQAAPLAQASRMRPRSRRPRRRSACVEAALGGGLLGVQWWRRVRVRPEAVPRAAGSAKSLQAAVLSEAGSEFVERWERRPGEELLG